VANRISLADIAAYGAIHDWMVSSSSNEKVAHCHVTRWFDHIQHLEGIFGKVSGLSLVQIDVPSKTIPGRLGETSPSKGSKKTSAKQAKTETDVVKEKTTAKCATIDSGKNGKEPVAERPVEDPTRLDIRVGVIRKVWRHPEAEKLYCEEIDIGEPAPRLIASGLTSYMTIEKVVDQKVLVLANMKPKSLKNFMSNGMVLCASSENKAAIEFLRPPAECQIGERVTFEGLTGEADVLMNTKTGKYPFSAVQPFFHLRDDGVYYKDNRWITSKGPCFCDSLKAGTID